MRPMPHSVADGPASVRQRRSPQPLRCPLRPSVAAIPDPRKAEESPHAHRRPPARPRRPPVTAERVHAHCDLPCGVYDPAQARIEAESVKAVMEKYNASDDEAFKVRAILIKEERADLVKHHLWVLWTDYFKPEHLERFPNLHDMFWKATKTAGEAKKTNDVAVADRLLSEIADIDKMFWESKK